MNGEDHLDLVGPFLILAEVNLGTGGLTQAENYLSRANWIVLKNPDASNALRSKLHRNFGKLCVALLCHVATYLTRALTRLRRAAPTNTQTNAPPHPTPSAE